MNTKYLKQFIGWQPVEFDDEVQRGDRWFRRVAPEAHELKELAKLYHIHPSYGPLCEIGLSIIDKQNTCRTGVWWPYRPIGHYKQVKAPGGNAVIDEGVDHSPRIPPSLYGQALPLP